MAKYEFNINGLNEGATFKNFKGLFLAVTGRIPPTGETLDSVKARMAKYLEYDLQKNINPNITSKQSVIITKIYNPPLTTIENRGKRGTYCDHLKPLILSTSCYKGKMHGLFNEWGVFKDYIFYLKQNDKNIAQFIDRFGINQCNIWTQVNTKYVGEQEYKRHLWYTMRDACKRALDSLQKDRLINWSEYYCIIPSALTDIEESSKKRFKSPQERREREKERQELIDEVLQDENCLIQPELLEVLNIFSRKWDGSEVTLSKYRSMVSVNEYISTPLKATSKQQEAIKNFELFLRQHTYKEFYKEAHYRKIEDLPNKKEFFDDFRLGLLYRKFYEEYVTLLIYCTSTWKEIEFQVVQSKEDMNAPQSDLAVKEASDKLTVAFIEYMEKQMPKHKYTLNKASFGDCIIAIGKAVCGHKYSLKSSTSAKELHALLKSLYGLQDNSSTSTHDFTLPLPQTA